MKFLSEILSGDARQEMDRIREEKIHLEMELASLEKPIVPHFRITDELVKNVRQSFIGMINAEKPVETKSFLRKFVERVDVSKEEVKIQYLLPSMKSASSDGGGGSYLQPTWLPFLDSYRTFLMSDDGVDIVRKAIQLEA